jgi:hypothetical protein
VSLILVIACFGNSPFNSKLRVSYFHPFLVLVQPCTYDCFSSSLSVLIREIRGKYLLSFEFIYVFVSHDEYMANLETWLEDELAWKPGLSRAVLQKTYG